MARLACLAGLLAVALAAGAQTRDRTLVVTPKEAVAGEARHALVIGNSAYTNGPLRNPVNDARAMAKALGETGFNVILLEDATHPAMRRAIQRFGNQIAKGGVGLFYYAGHGIQSKGRNYLVPVNAEIAQEDEIEFDSVDVNLVLAKMDTAKNALNIVILDACRNNPFARNFRSIQTGLAQMDAPTGTFIAFATAPGSVAADGTGANGVYTKHLLGEIDKPGLPIEQLFKQVRIAVMAETKGRQIPWESSSLRGEFAFRPGAQPSVAEAVAEAVRREREAHQREMEKMIQAALDRQRKQLEAQSGRKADAPATLELSFWESVRASANPADFRAYLARYPNGEFVELAKNRLAALGQTPAAAQPAPAIAAPAAKPPTVVASIAPTIPASSMRSFPRQGDTWTYRLIENAPGERTKQSNYVVKVAATSGANILDQVSRDGAPVMEWAHSKGTYLVAQVVSVFSPYLEVFEDLTPGMTIRRITEHDNVCGRPIYRCVSEGKVVGREVVQLAGGSFDATKVTVTQIWRGSQGGGNEVGERILTVWYSPQVKRAIKVSSRHVSGTSRSLLHVTNFDLELVSYKLQ